MLPLSLGSDLSVKPADRKSPVCALPCFHARRGDVPRKALEAVAVEAYRGGALTAAEVQELLGLSSRWDTEAFLKQSMAHLDYTQEDLTRDLEDLRRAG